MTKRQPILSTLLLLGLFALLSPASNAEPFFQGVKPCESCHSAELDVWQDTVHARSYKTVHKSDEAAELLAAVGTESSMKRDPLCISCHFSLRQKTAKSKAKAKAGPSCESCHGPSSDWIDLHNDYGDYDSAETEPADHRNQRLAAAEQAGLIGAFNLFGIASNCSSCHGLSRPDIEGESLAAMFANGHPLNQQFELVEYSQGSVRHRFYPPEMETNAELDSSGLSRLFIIGKAAQLIAANRAVAVAPAGDYKQAQLDIANAAKVALELAKSQPSVAAFLAEPNDKNGRKLADALKTVDLSSQVGGALPDPADYR